MSPLAARDGQILATWPTEMPIHTSLRRNVPHFGAPSRQRTANKRSKRPDRRYRRSGLSPALPGSGGSG